LKASRIEMQCFLSDVRVKLARLHNVPIEKVIIAGIRDGTTILDFMIIEDDGTTYPVPDDYRQFFGSNFVGCAVHPSFVQMRLRPSTFAIKWNRDFRIANNCPVREKRGGFDYSPPEGWQRFGMNVAGKFADGDTWLGMSNVQGEWCVAYHGTPGGT
jgi:hypothetical protein